MQQLSVASRGSLPGRTSAVSRGRSLLLQSAGQKMSIDKSQTPPSGSESVGLQGLSAGSGSFLIAAGTNAVSENQPKKEADEASLVTNSAPVQSIDEPCGLTPASLKHLRRQRDVLAEDKKRLEAELLALQRELRELRERVKVAESRATEAEAKEAEVRAQVEGLKQTIEEVSDEAREQRRRGDRLQDLNARLEEVLAEKEAEIESLRKALLDQKRLTQEEAEAAGQRASDNAEADELRRQLQELRNEKEKLLEEARLRIEQQEEMRRNVAIAMAAAEKALSMHSNHAHQVEMLRAAKLADAINQKVELHISVPRVTLSYNNAPPLFVSAATGLAEGRIRKFLDSEVFPNFEPLWVRMDNLDEAPDGSSKRTYSTKMLDRLTQAVKLFVARSQAADAGASLGEMPEEEEKLHSGNDALGALDDKLGQLMAKRQR